MLSRFVMAAAIAASSASLLAQGRETLETKVMVTDREIVFKWSKKHPWDAALIGSGVSLFAEYRTAQGGGLECLQPGNGGVPVAARRGAPSGCFAGNALLRREERTIHFRLPETLAAEPMGPVCLELRLPDQRLLPVRRATRTGEDTARFQVDEWARGAVGRLKTAKLEARRGELKAAMEAQATEVGEQQSFNRAKGWDSVSACSSQSAGRIQLAGSGRPIAPPSAQASVARQVCTIRVDTGRRYQGVVKPPEEMVAYLGGIDAGLREKWIGLRGQQLRRFLDDWDIYSATIATYKAENRLPHFGTYDDPISIQSLAEQALGLIKNGVARTEVIDPQWVLGYAGATVEAYNRCVTDGSQQLALNYRQATDLAAAVETLPERLRQQAVQACRTGVERIETMKTRLIGFQSELAGVDKELSSLSAAPVTIKTRELNGVTCLP